MVKLTAKIDTYAGSFVLTSFGRCVKEAKNELYDQMRSLAVIFTHPVSSGEYCVHENGIETGKHAIEVNKLKNGNVIVLFGKE